MSFYPRFESLSPSTRPDGHLQSRLTSAWSRRHPASGKACETWNEVIGFVNGIAVPLLKPSVRPPFGV
jgi:hypothetical protein